jgi:hypothetical protein
MDGGDEKNREEKEGKGGVMMERSRRNEKC